MAKHVVKCPVCSQYFDTNSEPYVMVSARRYAHAACAEMAEQSKDQEQKEKEMLETYIKQLFSIQTITPKIKKQIDTFHNKQGYGYSGMYKTLKYFFEVKGNSLEKANGGIGIVPYAWDDALIYWRAMHEAQMQNAQVEIQEYVLPTKEIHIPAPRREPMKQIRKLFGFLNEEEY